MKSTRYLVPVLIVLILVLTWAVTHSGKPDQPGPPGQPEAGLAPIEIDLPEPMFIGTPKDIVAPNIEKPTGKQRPPFLAPEGTVNLARVKPVSSSDVFPIIGDLELITDGDKEAGHGSFVELGPGKQWAQIDLEHRATIYAIVLWHYHMQARAYYDVVVQISDDPDFAADVTAVFNNDHDNSSGMGIGKDKSYVDTFEGRLIDCKGIQGRYVRLYSNGSSADEMNHYIEVEVYGKPAQ